MNMDSLDSDSSRINQSAWNRMARLAHPLAQPVREDELRQPLSVVDEIGWLGGDIHNWRVLCLAAGGGRHSALYSAAGANVTVVDLSPGMLELDRQVAQQYQFNVRLFQASMDNMPMLQEAEFDLVIQPVSTCYLRHIAPVFQEVARVLRPQGLYISQHKQPISLQASLQPQAGRYTIDLPANHPAPVAPTLEPSRLREPGTHEYIHTLETLLGGICRAGMAIEDLVEPRHGKPNEPLGSFAHRCHYISPYLRIKARRSGSASKLSLSY